MTDDAKLLAEIDRWKDATSHPPYGSQHWLAWGVDLLPKARDRIAALEQQLELTECERDRVSVDIPALTRQLAEAQAEIRTLRNIGVTLAEARPIPREPLTPLDVVTRLGVQQGSRVAASLRGDKETQEAAENWLRIIPLDHWHQIIADLRAMYDAALAQPEGEKK